MYLTWSMYTKQLTREERPRTSSVGHPLDDVMIYTTIFHGGRTGSVLRSRWAEARRRQIWHRRTMVLHRTMHNRPSKLFEPSELLSKQPRRAIGKPRVESSSEPLASHAEPSSESSTSNAEPSSESRRTKRAARRATSSSDHVDHISSSSAELRPRRPRPRRPHPE